MSCSERLDSDLGRCLASADWWQIDTKHSKDRMIDWLWTHSALSEPWLGPWSTHLPLYMFSFFIIVPSHIVSLNIIWYLSLYSHRWNKWLFVSYFSCTFEQIRSYAIILYNLYWMQKMLYYVSFPTTFMEEILMSN